MVKKFSWNPLAALQDKLACGGSTKHPLISCRNLTLGFMLAIGFILYSKYLLEDVSQGLANFPGPYEFLNFPIANNDTTHDSLDGPKRSGPAAPATPVPGARNSKGKPKKRKDRPKSKPKSKNAQKTPQDVRDGALKNPARVRPAAVSTPIAAGNNSKSTITTESVSVKDGNLTKSATSPEKFTVFLGVFLRAYEMKRRSIIRLAYSSQSSEDAQFTVRFILGGYTLETWLEGENATYGDLIVLQCKENLNEGKTYTYFSSLPDMGFKYDYVMKADDDSYVRFDNLAKQLKELPRTDLYYGYSLPCGAQEYTAEFRTGAGYVLSWDLVEWVRDSPIPRNNSIGTEDQLVADWFKEGGVAKNRPNSVNLFHDFHEHGGSCAKELSMDSILVHMLKTDEQWDKVLEFYNASRSLHN